MSQVNGFEEFFKVFDMYGQSANFSYMGKSYFSTTCGGCVSIIISLLILYYFIVLVIEMVFKNEAFSLTTVDYQSIPPLYNIAMDNFQIIPNWTIPKYQNENVTESVMQIAIAAMDQRTMTYRPIDPRYFNIHMFIRSKTKNQTKPSDRYVYFDLCRRFRDFDNEYDDWNLDKAYCLLSNFTVYGSTNNEEYSYLNLDVNRCNNNSLFYLNYTETQGYKNTYDGVNFTELELSLIPQEPKNPTTPDILNLFSLPQPSKTGTSASGGPDKSTLRNLENLEIEQDFTSFKPYDFITSKYPTRKLIDYTTPITMQWSDSDFQNINYRTEIIRNLPPDGVLVDNPLGYLNSQLPGPNDKLNGKRKYNKITCADQSLVDEVLNNLQVFVFFMNTRVNVTNYETPIQQYFDYKYFFTSYLMKKTNQFEFSNRQLETFDSALPQFLDKHKVVNYAMTITSAAKTFSDLDSSGNMFRAEFFSSNRIYNIERKYINLLDIFGWVGGISKILLAIGGLLTVSIMEIKLNESMINEFYSVIDPKNTENVKMKFKEFIMKMARFYEISTEKESKPGELENESKVFNKFFNFNLVKMLYNYELEHEKKNPDDFLAEIKDKNSKDQKEKKINDREKARYEIIYEIFKYRAFDKMYFSTWELIQKILCSCCLTGYLKKKNEVFNNACEKLKNDTDFPELLKAVREFQRINKIFLDDGQYQLFNSMVNKTITITKIEAKAEREERQRKEKDGEFGTEVMQAKEELRKEAIERKERENDEKTDIEMHGIKPKNEDESGKEETKKPKKEPKNSLTPAMDVKQPTTAKKIKKKKKDDQITDEEYKDFKNLTNLELALEKLMDDERLDRELDMNLLQKIQELEPNLIKEFFPQQNKPKEIEDKGEIKDEIKEAKGDEFGTTDYKELKEKFVDK